MSYKMSKNKFVTTLQLLIKKKKKFDDGRGRGQRDYIKPYSSSGTDDERRVEVGKPGDFFFQLFQKKGKK